MIVHVSPAIDAAFLLDENFMPLPNGYVYKTKASAEAFRTMFMTRILPDLRPQLNELNFEAHKHMQVVIQHREAADRHREDFGKFSQAPIDPFFAVEVSFAQQEGAADAARQAVIPAGYRHIDQMSASYCHG